MARRLMQPLGISRVTDITRLDRLGLPVFASVRPRGATLRVHAGKGLCAEDARVGALMEAVEYAVAERCAQQPPDAVLTVQALHARWPEGLTLQRFALRVGTVLEPGRLVPLVRCETLGRRRPLLVPSEIVHLGPVDGVPLFGPSTNGLASGNTLDEATLHGLLEVLERDAIALHRVRDVSAWVVPDSLPEPLAGWAQSWRQMGIELLVRHVPNAFGLPCFEAVLHEGTSTDVNLAAGFGLHADAAIAVCRAVSEAAQSRLSTIHGGRDDLTRFYAKYEPGSGAAARVAAEARVLERLRRRDREIRFTRVAQPATSPRALLRGLLERLARLGFPVLRRRLQVPGLDLLGLQVVKVVVPGCETSLSRPPRMGPRLLARALGHGAR